MPGFRQKRAPAPRGRKREWPVERALALHQAVNDILERSPRLTAAAACRRLTATPAWRGYAPATLEKRYSLFLGFLDRAHAWFETEMGRPPSRSPLRPIRER